MGFQTLVVEKEEHIGTLMFNRPETLNAISHTMIEEFPLAVRDLNEDNDIRVVIVTGTGRGFCSGMDVKQGFSTLQELRERYPAGDALPLLQGAGHLEAMGMRLGDMQKPTIAAVNGPAIGGGLDLAMACDFRIASEKATFSERYNMLANNPDIGGSYRLARLVGVAKAKELTFFADIIDAEEALRIGLVNKVVPHDELMDVVGDMAARLTKYSPIALACCKFLIDRNQDCDYLTAIEREMLVARYLHRTTDPYEGIAAFREKREPKYVSKLLGHEQG
jgi:enoyl-CoA hydratase/carnithine racemase